MTGAGETVDALKEAVKKDVETRSQGEYDDKYFVDLIEKDQRRRDDQIS